MERLLATLVTSLLALQLAGAQDETVDLTELYGLGDQSITLTAGLLAPLFYLFPTSADGTNITRTNLTPGGDVSLQWSAFLNSRVKIGAEAGGLFALDLDRQTVLIAPVTARVTYTFSSFPIEVPVFLGAGAAVMKLGDQLNISVLARPGLSVLYKYNSTWSFGGTASYWFVFEPAWGARPNTHRAFANFIDISPQFVYHF